MNADLFGLKFTLRGKEVKSMASTLSKAQAISTQMTAAKVELSDGMRLARYCGLDELSGLNSASSGPLRSRIRQMRSCGASKISSQCSRTASARCFPVVERDSSALCEDTPSSARSFGSRQP
jgi:hypothetical protein